MRRATLLLLTVLLGVGAALATEDGSPDKVVSHPWLSSDELISEIARNLRLASTILDQNSLDDGKLTSPRSPQTHHLAAELSKLNFRLLQLQQQWQGLTKTVEQDTDPTFNRRLRALHGESGQLTSEGWSFVQKGSGTFQRPTDQLERPQNSNADVNSGLALGGIIGQVRSQWGTKLDGVRVDIYNSSGELVTSAWTNSPYGRYTTELVLPPGTYYAFIEYFGARDLFEQLYDDLECPPICDPTTGTPITVHGGYFSSGIDFILDIHFRISGTVTDEATGLPVAEQRVTIHDSSGDWVGGGTSDNTGFYLSNKLRSGYDHSYTLMAGGERYYYKLFDNIPCPSDTSCDVTTGTPITVPVQSRLEHIDFALAKGGSISGTITDKATGLPIESVLVRMYDSLGDLKAGGYTDSDGTYSSRTAMATGTYHVITSNTGGYVDEIYDDIACEAGTECDPTSGDPISVIVGQDTQGIDFELERKGVISGTITDRATGLPIFFVKVYIWDSSGNVITYGETDYDGVYNSSVGLESGTYYASTYNNRGYLDEIFNNVACDPPCHYIDATIGTPISVNAGQVTPGIDFALVQGGWITGTVSDESSGLPIRGLAVWIYDDAGEWVSFGSSWHDGTYFTERALHAGTYYAKTFNENGYFAELYDNYDCSTDCDVTTGTPIAVTLGGETPDINFTVISGIFLDNFASGDTTAWSTTVP